MIFSTNGRADKKKKDHAKDSMLKRFPLPRGRRQKNLCSQRAHQIRPAQGHRTIAQLHDRSPRTGHRQPQTAERTATRVVANIEPAIRRNMIGVSSPAQQHCFHPFRYQRICPGGLCKDLNFRAACLKRGAVGTAKPRGRGPSAAITGVRSGRHLSPAPRMGARPVMARHNADWCLRA